MATTKEVRNKLKEMSFTSQNYSSNYCQKCGGYISGTWSGGTPPEPCRCPKEEETIIFQPPPLPKPTIFVEKKPTTPTIIDKPMPQEIEPNATLIPNQPVFTPYSETPTKKIEQGWQCPLCERIYSPKTIMCPNCPSK